MTRRIPIGGNGCFILVVASVVLALVVRIDAVDCPDIDNEILATDPDQDTALFEFAQPENYTCTPSPGSRFLLGATTVVCMSVDDGTLCTFQVQVNDEQPPTITCPLSRTANTNSGVATGTATWIYSVTDNVLVVTQSCSATSGAQFPIGVTIVKCTGADAAGNTGRCQFPISIVDNEDPVITSCPEDITSTIELINSQLPPLTSVITWDIPAASDNSGGPVGLTSTHEQGSEFSIGVTSVIYTAADEYGNSETCEFQVKVIVPPPNHDLIINNGPTSGVCLSVSWPESTDETLDDYSLYAYRHGEVRPDSSQRIVVPSGTSTYINHDVCRLQPGELYTIEVDGDQLSSAMHWTKPNTPGEVSLLPGTLGPSSFKFTWQRSIQNVEQYYWYYNGQSGYVSNTTDSVSIESVYPTTSGTVSVSAVVGSGQQRVHSSTATQRITTAALRPSELLAYNYTESTINLAWVSSSDTRGELDPYMLFIEPRDAEENYLETVGRVVEFKGLKSNTEYQIQLISNLGLMLETSQKTRPGRVANLRPTEVLENSITLAWDRPLEGAVESYDIWISPGEKSEPFNEGGTSHTFDKLTNNTEYFLRVVSIYNDMRSVPQDLMVTTGVTEPKDPNSVNITAIVLGVVLGLLVIILTVVLISTYLKYRKVTKDELPRVDQPRQTPYKQPAIQEPQTSSVTQVDSNQAYEPMAVNKPAPMQAQGSHYQNAPIKGIHQGPPTKKKIPPIPMHPKKSKQQQAENGAYAIPDIHG